MASQQDLAGQVAPRGDIKTTGAVFCHPSPSPIARCFLPSQPCRSAKLKASARSSPQAGGQGDAVAAPQQWPVLEPSCGDGTPFAASGWRAGVVGIEFDPAHCQRRSTWIFAYPVKPALTPSSRQSAHCASGYLAVDSRAARRGALRQPLQPPVLHRGSACDISRRVAN